MKPPAEQPEDRTQEGRKHVFVINGAPAFLNLMRDLFQSESYNVTTTNFVPNSFSQIEARQPDALIVDIVIGQEAAGNCWSACMPPPARPGYLSSSSRPTRTCSHVPRSGPRAWGRIVR